MTPKTKTINNWVALNKVLFIYKLIGLGLMMTCLGLVAFAMVLMERDTIIVFGKDKDQEILVGTPGSVSLTPENVSQFVREYVKARYSWSTLKPEDIVQNLRPLVTDGFESRTLTYLKNLKVHDLQNKRAKQDVSGLRVHVTEDQTVATFDRILRIEDIPLIVPTQISVNLVRGKPTRWNPMGLYVNGTTIHEQN